MPSLLTALLLFLMTFWLAMRLLRSPRLFPPTTVGGIHRVTIGRKLLVVAFSILVAAIGAYKVGNATFSPEAWRAPGSSSSQLPGMYTPRERMLGDLIANVLPRLKYEEAIELLGRSGGLPSGERYLSYVIGPNFIIDNDVLVLEYDKSGNYVGHSFGND